MKLMELLPHLSGEIAETEITGVTCDSRNVKNGYAFICIVGAKSDGHLFAETALKSGAAVIVAERDLGLDSQVVVDDTHRAYADMCAGWFGNPAKDLTLIGVTGTNGKTSVSYMIKKIIEQSGYKTGLIGTIQNMIGEEVIASVNTTPNAYELNSLFSLMKKSGCKYVVMEVSSHALDQKRVFGLEFEIAVFTNLTQDHLDYHITMENYLEAKKTLFKSCKKAIVNRDDPYSSKLTEGLDCQVITYSAESDEATFTAKNICYRPDGVDYELVGFGIISRIHMNVAGKFTVYNSMAAGVCGAEMGFSITNISKALCSISGVKGRAEVVPSGRDFTIIIDYAHTPDGLQNILYTFKDCPKNRLIAVFGCGGDRDKTKRPLMGEIAARLADYVVVTSDNPRTENPGEIIKDILVGMKGSPTTYKVIENRIEAIHFAVSIAKKGDIIVLAGKGHETYQILNTGTIHLDEREVVAEALAGLNTSK